MRDWQDDGAPDVRILSHRYCAARSARKCEWCSHPIKVGERYARIAQMVDGDFQFIRCHPGGSCVMLDVLADGPMGQDETPGRSTV